MMAGHSRHSDNYIRESKFMSVVTISVSSELHQACSVMYFTEHETINMTTKRRGSRLSHQWILERQEQVGADEKQ